METLGSYIIENVKKKELSGIVFFFLLLFLSYCIWKFSAKFLNTDEHLKGIYTLLIRADANLTRYILNLLTIDTTTDGSILFFSNQKAILITPQCSGLQHIFEICFILLFYSGPAKHKVWYIPLSIILIYLAAVIHLVILGIFMFNRADLFSWAHNNLSRWVFFSFFFGIWLIWEELIRKKDKQSQGKEPKIMIN